MTMREHSSVPRPEHPPIRGWRLRDFSGSGYEKGRGVAIQAAWFATMNLIFTAWWCPSLLRNWLLRLFGAEIGENVLIRHRVRVLWPWKLRIGSDTWIGEDAWLLNLELITIENDVCISQGAYLCTGSHDRYSPSFEFDNGAITIGEQSWVATQALVLRGVSVGRRSVIGARAIITRDLPEGSTIAAGRRW